MSTTREAGMTKLHLILRSYSIRNILISQDPEIHTAPDKYRFATAMAMAKDYLADANEKIDGTSCRPALSRIAAYR